MLSCIPIGLLHKIANRCTANVIAVKFTGFPCVPLEPCKVHVFITGKWVVC
jgi:hypothetical protein